MGAYFFVVALYQICRNTISKSISCTITSLTSKGVISLVFQGDVDYRHMSQNQEWAYGRFSWP